MIETLRDKNILYASLNWGFGHVSRSIGIIRQLIDQGNTVILCGDSVQIGIYKQYFPSLTYELIPSYPFLFNDKGEWTRDLLRSLPGLLSHLRREKIQTEELVIKHLIDQVISDHRYGFISGNVSSTIVLHQLNLPISPFAYPAQLVHRYLVNRFSSIAVLDHADNRLAGKLSKRWKTGKIKYIGIYSRFTKLSTVERQSYSHYTYEYAYIISGPGSYSQQFLEEIIAFHKGQNYPKAILLCSHTLIQSDVKNIDILGVDQWKFMDEAVLSSRKIVTRSGYSTLMDLEILGKEAVLVPTLGQAEQNYLASFHQAHPKWTFAVHLSDLETVARD